MKTLYDMEKDSIFNKLHPYHECPIVTAESIYRNPAEIDVSVIIPCYNAETFLPSCIESLASQQTRYTYEVILVNDGSTDGTKDILEDAASRYAPFHCIHQVNQGAGAARNRGMSEARGEYLIFVDADDIVSVNYVDALVDCVKTTGADLGACAYYAFKENGATYKKVEWPKTITTGNLNGTPWGKIYHRKLFDRLLWPSGYWHQDTILAFLVFPRVKKLASTNKCTYGYRSNAQNITNSSRKSNRALDTLYISSLVLSQMKALGVEDWLYTLEGHDRLVNQFYLNSCRIRHLPEECASELFRLQSEFYHAMKHHAGGKHRYDSPLYARALRKSDLAMAKRAVKLVNVNKALHIASTRAAMLLRRG